MGNPLAVTELLPRAAAAAALAVGLAASIAGCATAPAEGARASASPPPPSLPEAVVVKTRARAFTRLWDLALDDGRLWVKPVGASRAAWRLAPPSGLPRASGRSPDRLVAVSADGDNVVVVDQDDGAYYAKLSGLAEDGELTWTSEFGFLPWRREALRLPAGWRSVAISHRGPDAAYYEDIDGNRFPVSVGVSTLYVLDASGQVIRYADPWLPPTWETHVFFGPRRGRLVAERMSASASTMFVIDRFGEMHTRLADYDTSGENPIPGWYTYERGRRRDGSVRTLPGEGWRRQPPVPGAITADITILQTGEGNAARELRVAGLGPDGGSGYWSKPLLGEEWTFVSAPELVVRSGDLLDDRAHEGRLPPDEERLGPAFDRDYAGVFVHEGDEGVHEHAIALRGFNPLASPSTIEVATGPARVRARLHTRRVRPGSDGALRTDDAVVELLPPERGVDIPAYRGARAEIFGDERLLEVDVRLSPDGARLEIERDGWLPGQLRVELRRVGD